MANFRKAAVGSVLAALAMACSAGAAGQSARVDDSDREAATLLADYLCSNCHGREGRSDYPLYPNLAGQQAAYLESQLKAFRSQRRNDEEAHQYMWDIASLLNDEIIVALGQYYSGKVLAPGKPGDAAAVAAGKALYEKGDPSRRIPPCSACHGARAQGLSIFPRLAGQQGQYLARQMSMIQLDLRAAPIMHGMIKELASEEIFDLATYLQSL